MMERQHDEDYWSNHRDWDRHGPFSDEYKASILEDYAKQDAARAADEAIYRRINGGQAAIDHDALVYERTCPTCRGLGQLIDTHAYGPSSVLACYRCDGHGVIA